MFSSGWFENTAIKPTTASHAHTISVWLNEWLPTHSLMLTHVDDFLFSTIEDVFRRSRREVFYLCPAPHARSLGARAAGVCEGGGGVRRCEGGSGVGAGSLVRCADLAAILICVVSAVGSCAFGRENSKFVESAPHGCTPTHAHTPPHNVRIHTTYSCSKQ
jgi:hypothetical protein